MLLTTFKGHQAAIWSAIQLSSKQIITCSADKTILVHEIIPSGSEHSSVVVKKLTGNLFKFKKMYLFYVFNINLCCRSY